MIFLVGPNRRHLGRSGRPFISGCVTLENPDLDFQNLNPDFPIEREFHLREIRPQVDFN